MLVMVLGHSQCGAVKAAVEYVMRGTVPPGHIANLVQALAPAARAAVGANGDRLHAAIVQNVHDITTALPRRSPIVAAAMRERHVRIVGALYDLTSGNVTLL